MQERVGIQACGPGERGRHWGLTPLPYPPDRTPRPPPGAQPRPAGLAEDEAGEGRSPRSLGAPPLATCPLMERPVPSLDQSLSPVLEAFFEAPGATAEFAQSLVACIQAWQARGQRVA